MFFKESFCNWSSCPRTSLHGQKKIPKKALPVLAPQQVFGAVFGNFTGISGQDDQLQKDSVQTI